MKAAVLTVFKDRFSPERFRPIVASFDEGAVIHAGEDVTSAEYVALLVRTGGRVTPTLVIGALVSAFVFWTHRANIARLRRGEETRFDVWRRARGAAGPAGGSR